MNWYLVLLKDNDPKTLKKSELRAHWEAVTQQAIQRICSVLEERNLLSEVETLGEPMGLPVFFICCTARVAKELECLGEVDKVILDESQLQDREDFLGSMDSPPPSLDC